MPASCALREREAQVRRRAHSLQRPLAGWAWAAGLSPLAVITTVREMCEKLKVVVGSDNLSKEAQVRGAGGCAGRARRRLRGWLQGAWGLALGGEGKRCV